jgi:hypothetical protein
VLAAYDAPARLAIDSLAVLPQISPSSTQLINFIVLKD